MAAVDPVTSIGNAIANMFSFLEPLSPAILEWLHTRIPLAIQTAMAQRIRRAKRICRRNKLTRELISDEVKLLFSDLSGEQQSDIEALISFELGK